MDCRTLPPAFQATRRLIRSRERLVSVRTVRAQLQKSVACLVSGNCPPYACVRSEDGSRPCVHQACSGYVSRLSYPAFYGLTDFEGAVVKYHNFTPATRYVSPPPLEHPQILQC